MANYTPSNFGGGLAAYMQGAKQIRDNKLGNSIIGLSQVNARRDMQELMKQDGYDYRSPEAQQQAMGMSIPQQQAMQNRNNANQLFNQNAITNQQAFNKQQALNAQNKASNLHNANTLFETNRNNTLINNLGIDKLNETISNNKAVNTLGVSELEEETRNNKADNSIDVEKNRIDNLIGASTIAKNEAGTANQLFKTKQERSAQNRYDLFNKNADFNTQVDKNMANQSALPNMGIQGLSSNLVENPYLSNPNLQAEDKRILENDPKEFNPNGYGSMQGNKTYQQMRTNLLETAKLEGWDESKMNEAILQLNNNWQTKTNMGVTTTAQNFNETQLGTDFKNVQGFKDDYAKNPSGADSNTLGAMKGIENRTFANLKPAQQTLVKDTIKSMKANQVFVSGVGKVLNDYNDDNLPSSGIYDSSKQKLEEYYGSESEQMLKNVDFKSRSGRLLGAYMKATSGLAVSDAERAFLTDLFTGGYLDDEKTILARMKSFQKSMVDDNNINAGQIFDSAPFSATKYRQYDDYKNYENKKNTSSNIGAPVKNQNGTITYDGKTYDASGKLIN